MLPTWFERFKTRFIATLFGETSEFEKARESAYVNERLQNNLLIPTNSSRMTSALIDHDPLQVRSQGIAGHSCGTR